MNRTTICCLRLLTLTGLAAAAALVIGLFPVAAQADALDDLHARIDAEYGLPAPVTLPAAELAPGCRTSPVIELFTQGNKFLLQANPDLRMACARYAQAVSPPGSPSFLPAHFNYGIAAGTMNDFEMARSQYRLAIGAINRARRQLGYTEPAARDYPIDCSSIRSYHYYINLCAIYAIDSTYSDGAKLAEDISKQPPSTTCIYPHLAAFAAQGGDDAPHAHLLWALSNYERLFSYPPHQYHPVLRFNCALVLLRLRDYQAASILLDFTQTITLAPQSLPQLADSVYSQRATEEARLLSPEQLLKVRGIVSAHLLDHQGVVNYLAPNTTSNKTASLSVIVAHAGHILTAPGNEVASYIKQLDTLDRELAEWDLAADDLATAVIRLRLAPSIRKIEAAMADENWEGALRLIAVEVEELDHPTVNKILRPFAMTSRMTAIVTDPVWIIAGTLLLALAVALAVAFIIISRNLPQYRRTLACEWIPPAGRSE